MSTLYLHIGTPKTATTAIQLFCWENADLLRMKGYDYPKPDYKYDYVRKERNGHFFLGRGSEEVALKYKNAGYAMLEESLKNYENVILSDENIWHYTGATDFNPWYELKEFCDLHGTVIKVIVYLRRQDDFIQSWLNQQIQDNVTEVGMQNLSEFLANPRYIIFDYYELLERIAKVVGKENITARVFESSKFEGNGHTIQSDFLKQIGLEMTDEFTVADQKANITLSRNVCEIKREINKIIFDRKDAKRFFKKVTTSYQEACKNKENSQWFSLEERQEFLSTLADSNEKLAREYFGLDAETPFHTDMRDLPKWTPDNAYMREDIIQYFAAADLLLLEEIQKLKDNASKNKKKLKEYKKQLEEYKKKTDAQGKKLVHYKEIIDDLGKHNSAYRALRKIKYKFTK